jgi:hypothetical protein
MNKIKWATTIFVVAIFAFVVLCSCAGGFFLLVHFMADKVPLAIVMANNTDEDFTVQISGSKYDVPNRGITELSWFQDMDAKIGIRSSTGETWYYQWEFTIPRHYYKTQRIYVQIEKDGKLYALPSKIIAPVPDLPRQPPGYPLTKKDQPN